MQDNLHHVMLPFSQNLFDGCSALWRGDVFL
jgi:hypothetical protein